MTADRWEKVEELFHRLAPLDVRARAAALAEIASGDPVLSAELESLLLAHDSGGEVDRLQSILAQGPTPGPAEDLTGSAIRQYAIGPLIGRGGMGDVYRARDTRLDREVALKFLPLWLSRDPDAEQRFLMEARVLSALDHTNVCTLLEIDRTDQGRLFLVTPFYEGETLRDRLSRGPLAVEDAVEIALQVVRGLAAAHERGVVHRDIKPANLLVTSAGQVKILDFGIAKLADVSLTRPGQTPGTTHYMSPEQAAGAPVDARTDLWSLGVVLYEMLAGQVPFRGDRPAVMEQLSRGAAIPLPNVVPGPPDALSPVLDRLLQRSPEDRYPSAVAAAADLAMIRAGEAIPGPRGRRRSARTTQWIALGGATLVIALATTWFRSSRSPSMPLDPGRILVVPFQAAVHPSLDYLGEGMVDLVAARLNGETGSRTVDPRSGLVAWRQATGGARGDLPLAGSARIARDLGAGLLLTGSVVGASDRLTLNGTLFDAASLAVRVRVSTTGPADSLTALVDRLVGQLLAREAVLPRHQLGALTTASLPALQAYLEGRRSYRLGRYREAVVHLESALHHDSTFALAAIQLWFAAGPGQLTAEPGTQAEALRLAWAARDRLSPVDRLFLDALAGPRYPDPTPRHELRAALRRALDASPDQPEVLALMGMFHGGDVIRGEAGAEPRSSFYFRKALKLDSAYGIPVHNLVREAASNGDAMTVQRLVRRYLAADSTSELAQLLQWLDAASSADQRAILQIRSRIPHMHPTALGWIVSHALLFGLDMEGAESALVALRATARSDRELRHLLGWEWDHMGNRGRLDALWRARESRALETARDGPIEELNLSAEQRARGQRAIWLLGTKLFWGGDTTGIGAALDLMEDGYRRSPAPDGHPFARVIVAESACFAGMGRLATREIAAARKAVAALRNLLARPWTVPERPSHVACAATLEAALAVAEGRPDARRAAEQADSVLRAQPPVRVVSNRMHLLLARAFDALSDPVAALRVIRRRELSNPPDYFATILREEGHLAVRAGDREGAIRAFQHYLVLRADPDPALLPEVQEVRQALAALIAR